MMMTLVMMREGWVGGQKIFLDPFLNFLHIFYIYLSSLILRVIYHKPQQPFSVKGKGKWSDSDGRGSEALISTAVIGKESQGKEATKRDGRSKFL